MRGIVFGLLLVPLIACSDVWAEDAQIPNATTGGSQQANQNQKLPSEQVSPSSQIDRSKNRKQTSMTRSRALSTPAALPLSSAETYASEHPGNLAVSSAPKPAPPAGNSPSNSWTGFYVGAGVGAAQP
ncbi:hypothetical protein [Bradyrhizobium sp. S69]|uniref:hypothetical protein n=1 Tax=Bradyrhizobium sp. S69 TaxID=1641856 RepID=UPI00131C55D6|nr:hypothetical protein [Bradyrhizobium sp. S69]